MHNAGKAYAVSENDQDEVSMVSSLSSAMDTTSTALGPFRSMEATHVHVHAHVHPSSLEVDLHNDFQNVKERYRAFRKEAKAQMEFQIDLLSEDGSDSGGRMRHTHSPTTLFGKLCGASDDYSLPSTPSQSSSPPPSPSSPAPFRALPTTGNVRGLCSTPPLAQPELQYYLSSPPERELYNHLRTHTKARYLEFRNQVSELVSPSKLRQSPPPPPSTRERRRSEEEEETPPSQGMSDNGAADGSLSDGGGTGLEWPT